MPEYSLPFAEKLAKAASLVAADGLDDPEAMRTVLYLSLLSTEVSLKAMLEKAGMALPKIRKRSHDLAGLMKDLGRCTVGTTITPGKDMRVPASRLRGVPLTYASESSTVGKVIDAEREGASAYPGGVRYGKLPKHYPPELVSQMATAVALFARKHWTSLHAA